MPEDASNRGAAQATVAPGETWRTSALPTAAPTADADVARGRNLLREPERRRFDAALTVASPLDRAALMRIVASPGFVAATAEQRKQILELACGLRGVSVVDIGSQGAAGAKTPLQALALSLELQVDGRPRLLAPDSTGATALTHLNRLVTTPLHADVADRLRPTDNKQMAASVLQELADPRRIEQSTAGTCSVTSVQSYTALRMPGEYARIMTGLALDGQAQLANGDTLSFDADGTQRLGGANVRSPSERMFQAALMQYAAPNMNYVTDPNGHEGFNPTTALNELPTFWKILAFIFFPLAIILSQSRVWEQGGLTDEEAQHAMAGVFNRPYTSVEGQPGLDAARAIADPRSGNLEGTGVFLAMGRFIPSVPDSGHMLVITEIDNSTVPPALILRNPWGSQPLAKPGESLGPGGPEGSTWVDPAAGLMRLPLTPEILARTRFQLPAAPVAHAAEHD